MTIRSCHCAAGDAVSATQDLHGIGQSIWLDNITRNQRPKRRFIYFFTSGPNSLVKLPVP